MNPIEKQLRAVLKIGIQNARKGETYGRVAAGIKITKLLKDLEYSRRTR